MIMITCLHHFLLEVSKRFFIFISSDFWNACNINFKVIIMFVVCLLKSYREGGYIWNAKIITRPDFYRDICWNDNRRNRSTCLDKNTNALFFVLDEAVSQTRKVLEGIALVALALHHLLQQLS